MLLRLIQLTMSLQLQQRVAGVIRKGIYPSSKNLSFPGVIIRPITTANVAKVASEIRQETEGKATPFFVLRAIKGIRPSPAERALMQWLKKGLGVKYQLSVNHGRKPGTWHLLCRK